MGAVCSAPVPDLSALQRKHEEEVRSNQRQHEELVRELLTKSNHDMQAILTKHEADLSMLKELRKSINEQIQQHRASDAVKGLEKQNADLEQKLRQLKKDLHAAEAKLTESQDVQTSRLKELEDLREQLATATSNRQEFLKLKERVTELEHTNELQRQEYESSLTSKEGIHNQTLEHTQERLKNTESALARTQYDKQELEKQLKDNEDLMEMFRTVMAPYSGASTPGQSLAKDGEDDLTEDGSQNLTTIPDQSPHQISVAKHLFQVKDCITGKKTNWDLECRALADWTGVALDDGGQLTGLNLSDSGVKLDLADLHQVFGPHMCRLKLDKNPELKGNIAHVLGGSLDSSSTWLRTQSLQSIDLHYTQVSGSLVVFKNCPHLRNVAIGYTRIHGDVAVFKGCPKLQELRLYKCPGVTGDISVFKTCSKLQWLDLTGTGVAGSIEVFANCSHLQWLWLDETNVTGDIAVFAATPKLVELWLNGTKVKGNRRQLERALPKCAFVLEDQQEEQRLPQPTA